MGQDVCEQKKDQNNQPAYLPNKNNILLMKEPLQNRTAANNADQLPIEERYNALLTQLQERNSNNQQFIKKFISKIKKKYHHREIPTPRKLQTYPEIEEQEQQRGPAQPPPSRVRFHTQEHELLSPLRHSITDSQVIRSHISVMNEFGGSFDKKQKRNSFRRTDKIDSRNTFGQDEGFKKYLKKVYLKEVSNRLPKPVVSLKKNNLERKSFQGPETKCLNIKSMVFGSQELNSIHQQQQIDHLPSEQQIDNSPLQSSQTAINSKLSNIFLPTITRQNGWKKDKAKMEKMIKMTDGTQDRSDSKCRALWLSQSLNRIGFSFRINTININKHS